MPHQVYNRPPPGGILMIMAPHQLYERPVSPTPAPAPEPVETAAGRRRPRSASQRYAPHEFYHHSHDDGGWAFPVPAAASSRRRGHEKQKGGGRRRVRARRLALGCIVAGWAATARLVLPPFVKLPAQQATGNRSKKMSRSPNCRDHR